jgi:hypothetical protein
MNLGDEAFNEMAQELHEQLVRMGADPTNPPATRPPAARAWLEYQSRGGWAYEDPNELADALVERVQAIGKSRANQ